MPTRHRRIGVVLDVELRDALALAASALPASTDAARLRELALIGARSLHGEGGGPQQLRNALDELGATAERGDLLSISRRLRRTRASTEAGSESLDWVRGSR